MDFGTITAVAQYVGVLGAALVGGMAGGKKSLKDLISDVAWLKSKVALIMERLGMDTEHKPGNGKVTEVGRAEQLSGGEMTTLGKRALIVALALFTAGPSLVAAPGGCTNAPSLTPFAYEEISVSSTAIGFTVLTAFPDGEKGADMAVVSVEDDAIRYREDGLAPTATVGQPVAVDTSFTVCGEASIRRVLFIRQTTDADLNVSYYREGGQ